MFLHKKGARQPDALNPDNWAIDAYAFSIPASRLFMSRLFMNLSTNFQLYPEWTTYLKERQPKTLIVWGRNDPIIWPAAAEFVKQVVPAATYAISTPATSRLTKTPMRLPRRSSRCSPDRADAEYCMRLSREQELARSIVQLSSRSLA